MVLGLFYCTVLSNVSCDVMSLSQASEAVAQSPGARACSRPVRSERRGNRQALRQRGAMVPFRLGVRVRGPAAADTQHMSLWANRGGGGLRRAVQAPRRPVLRDRESATGWLRPSRKKKSHWHAGLEQCRCVPRGPPAIGRTGVVAGLAATYSGSHSFTGHWDIRTSRMLVMHGTVN